MADAAYFYPDHERPKPSTPPLPETVEVGPYTYRVYSDPSRELIADEPDHDMIGRTNNKTLEIDVAPDLPDSLFGVTLLHEVLHAVCYTVGARDDMDEEQAVEMLAPMLYDTLRRNPGLVDYLCR